MGLNRLLMTFHQLVNRSFSHLGFKISQVFPKAMGRIGGHKFLAAQTKIFHNCGQTFATNQVSTISVFSPVL